MKYRELKQAIFGLNEDQLEQEVRFVANGFSKLVGDVWILDEDHVNPTGDGMEPIGHYASDDPEDEDYLDPDEPIVACEGDVFLREAE